MVRSESFNKILKLKKNKVIEIVHRICNKRSLPIPTVNFEGCDGEHAGQLAHYHSGNNIICISERQLIKQDFEDLEKTMIHEVSHILVQHHSPRFSEEEAISSIAGWKPQQELFILLEEIKLQKKKKRPNQIKQDVIIIYAKRKQN